MTDVSQSETWPRRLPPCKGQIWTDNMTERTHPCRITVLRVARDGSWADIRVRQFSGVKWTKRMPLPFPQDWVLL